MTNQLFEEQRVFFVPPEVYAMARAVDQAKSVQYKHKELAEAGLDHVLCRPQLLALVAATEPFDPWTSFSMADILRKLAWDKS